MSDDTSPGAGAVRTRFAPSPTGSLHVGNARIAVLDWLFTRKHGGRFVLRIEDTDIERHDPNSEAGIFADLAWLGLHWDEGPGASFEAGHHPGARAIDPAGRRGSIEPDRGEFGPYRQSQRREIHHGFADRLRQAGLTYDCFCAPADDAATNDVHGDSAGRAGGGDGAAERADPARDVGEPDAAAPPAGSRHRSPRGECHCASLASDPVARRRAKARSPALRFRVPRGRDIVVRDVVRGDVRFDAEDIADFVVLRADGRPTYNFAVVADDIAMRITHVIRGAGHLSNTPRQILLFEALGAEPPVFAHVPTVLGPDRQKLSKRHGARALADYRADGYHPDAIVNYLSLLSWSSPSGEEVLDRERLIAEISLDRIGAADVVFDPAKLRWLSARHIERMPLDALARAVEPFARRAGWLAPEGPISAEAFPDAVDAVRTHLTAFSDVVAALAPLFPPDDAPAAAHALIASEGAARVLRAALSRLDPVSDWSAVSVGAAIKLAGKDANARGRWLYEPLRIALTGRPHGPPLTAIMRVQGRRRTLASLASALEHLSDAAGDFE